MRLSCRVTRIYPVVRVEFSGGELSQSESLRNMSKSTVVKTCLYTYNLYYIFLKKLNSV